ncbi:MAG: TatD family hydrolase [Porticoccaceae bacterium]|nr:TatD family hydrolase [Porticoccaceae bacterium]
MTTGATEQNLATETPPKFTLVDIGVNLTNPRFNHDQAEVLQRARAAGVDQVMITGTCVNSSEQALALCEQYANDFPGMLYATAGVHPHDAKDWNSDTLPRLRTLAEQPQVVAIGETGLDFNRDYSPRVDQEKVFETQIELAIECRLPLFLHERDAHQRQLDILKNYRDQFSDAVIHCFTGTRSELFNYLDLNLHIGITGWVCDPRRGLELQGLVKNIPLDRLMIESDAPFLLPKKLLPGGFLPGDNAPKHQATKKSDKNRNEPAYLPWVLSQLAECRQESEIELARATTATARRFFRLKPS